MELDGVTAALNDFVCPSTKVRFRGVTSSPVAGTVFSTTVTLNDLDTLPILTVIVELPTFKADTLNPLYTKDAVWKDSFLTVATLLFEEVTVKSPSRRMPLWIKTLRVAENFCFEKKQAIFLFLSSSYVEPSGTSLSDTDSTNHIG